MFREWFEEKISYSGSGQATFENPRATLIGPASATVGEFGELKVQFTAQKVESEESTPFGTMSVLQGAKMHGAGGNSLGFGLDHNPCLSFCLNAETGSLELDRPIIDRWTMEFGSEKVPLTLSPSSHAVFRGRESGSSPTYWVLPIMNLSKPFWSGHYPPQEIVQHPLRIYRHNTAEPESPFNELIRNQNESRVLVFMIGERPAFIEPLPTFELRAKQLRERELQSTITALMIGECLPDRASPQQVLIDLPFHLLFVLGLASESMPGVPWVELRDESGTLVSRTHRTYWAEAYRQGTVFVEGSFQSGLPDLMTSCAAQSSESNTYALREVLRLLIEASKLRINLDDSLGRLFRAMDTLWTYIDEVRKDPRLRGSTPGTAKGSPGFGQRVAGLLTYLGLADAAVCERRFQQSPISFSFGGSDGSWAGFISQTRGVVMHRGFGLAGATDPDYRLAAAAHRHFVDLLGRVVLTLLGHRGTYQPRVLKYTERYPIGWVTNQTTTDELGYEDAWPI